MKKQIVLFGLMTACSPSLDKTYDWDNEEEELEELLDTADLDDTGVLQTDFRVLVDATSREDWALIDLETGDVFGVEDPSGSSEWDISVQRFIFKLNSPLNGPEDVGALIVGDESYEEYEIPPSEGYLQDMEDADDDGVPEYVFNEWYDYDISTHILTPKNQFYVIRNRNDRFFKLYIEDYYSSAGTSAMITLVWSELFTTETPSE